MICNNLITFVDMCFMNYCDKQSLHAHSYKCELLPVKLQYKYNEFLG